MSKEILREIELGQAAEDCEAAAGESAEACLPFAILTTLAALLICYLRF